MNWFIVLVILLNLSIVSIVLKKFMIRGETKLPLKVGSLATKGMLVGYFGILFGFTISAAFITPLEPSYDKFNAEEIERFDELFTKLSGGEDEGIPAGFLVEEWSNSVKGKAFKVVNENPNWMPLTVFIVRGETNGGKVEASLYKGFHVINEYVVRDYMDDIELEWQEDRLTIKGLKNEAITMSFFKHDFVFQQLEEERFTPSTAMSEQYPILYIKVPDSVELEVDEGAVHIVES